MLSLVKVEQEVWDKYPPPDEFEYEAKCEWFRSIESVVEMGVFNGPNISLFESYCVASGEAKELKKILDVDGRIVNGKPHPAYKMMLDAMVVAKNLWMELKPKKLINKDEDEDENNWKKDKGLLA